MADQGALKAGIERDVKENFIMVYSKSWCPYCNSTKSLLNELTAKFPEDKKPRYVELDLVENGSEMQNILASQITQQRSVPQIFINSEFIGGNDALQALKGRMLDEKLAAGLKA